MANFRRGVKQRLELQTRCYSATTGKLLTEDVQGTRFIQMREPVGV
jgi:hypothetical protein